MTVADELLQRARALWPSNLDLSPEAQALLACVADMISAGQHVQALSLREGDVLVLKTDRVPTSHDEHQNLEAYFRLLTARAGLEGKVSVLVISKNDDLSIVRKAS